MNKSIFLSVVIPCYNESENISEGKINQVINYLSNKKYLWEIIIVDDGSTDDSLELVNKIIVDNKNIRIISNSHRGKATTVITGMLKATGQYILFTDLDQATPISQVDKLLPFLNDGFDIVIGSRKGKRRGAPFIRAIMGPGFTIIRKLILNFPDITDTQCGFKMFKRVVARQLFGKLKLYKDASAIKGSQVTAGFDVEILYLGSKLNYKIKEVEVDWNYVDTRRVNPIRDSIYAVIDLVKIRWNLFKGVYKL